MNTALEKFATWGQNVPIPEILSDPESFMGPNAGTILNFWTFIDRLTKEQWQMLTETYYTISNCSYAREARDVSNAAEEIQYCTWWVPKAKYNLSSSLPIEAAFELIAMHKLIKEGKPFIALPLFEQCQ